MSYTTHAVTFVQGSLGMVVGCREGDAAAVVVSAKPGGAAAGFGVVVGDVVSRVNGRRVGDYDAVLLELGKAGKPVTITFEREGPAEAAATAAAIAATVARPPPAAPLEYFSPASEAARPAVRAAPQAVHDLRADTARAAVARAPAAVAAPPAPRVSVTAHGAGFDAQHRDAPILPQGASTGGKVHARWEQLQQKHKADQLDRLQTVKQNISDDVRSHFTQLDMEHVKGKVKYFNDLFSSAVADALSDSKAMGETDRARAAQDRFRRREEARNQVLEDAQKRRASRPRMENVAAHPDELCIALSVAPAGMKTIYALVDVSRLNESVALNGEKKKVRKLGEVGADDALDDHAAGKVLKAAQDSHEWKDYTAPLKFTKAGRFAILSKTVPIVYSAATLDKFEAAAEHAEATGEAPKGYAALACALVDAVRLGLIGRSEAYAQLEAAKTRSEANILTLAEQWRAAADEKDAAKAALFGKLRAQRALARSTAEAEKKAAGLSFTDSITDSLGLSSGANASRENSRLAAVTFELFVGACSDNDLALNRDGVGANGSNGADGVAGGANGKDGANGKEGASSFNLQKSALLESEISTAVYELGASPPLMQHEEYPAAELSFVGEAEAAAQDLRCVKCGSRTKLYGHGTYAICRVCALEGAGVLVDPGARRMWFSQMIGFVGSREIPLPKSQPLLAQILRVMQQHPGLSVRFEGHVNSYCGIDCDGSGVCINSKGVPGKMCQKCPGGAMGLSFARADAIRSFVSACGIEEDRLHAQGFAGTRRLTGDVIDEETGHINRRVEVHTLLC
ncbi:hypothetical protein M885DRAFT_618489 [Pelagophyceae sp. CCMP2097]|nr:hypothetical protein M885DRAFT_618489 [Pelagophyceae sp. CCMP2097]